MALPSPARPWHERRALLETPSAALAVGSTGLGLVVMETIPWASWMILGLVAFATTLKVALLRAADRAKDAEAAYALQSALWVLHEAVWHQQGGRIERTDTRLRIVLHRVSEDGLQLVQATPYVGYAQGSPAGTRLSVRCGAAGRAVRTGRVAAIVYSPDDATRRQQLVGQGFTELEARAVTPGRVATLAIPMHDGSGRVIGALYADSDHPEFFSKNVRAAFLAGVAGLASWVVRTYR